jgi:hypothetical protein
MGIKVQYVGSRSYTEFRLGNKVVGFGHGEIQEMEGAAIPVFRSLVDSGSTMWRIVEDKTSQTTAMKEAIEPTVEETVVEEEESTDVDYESMTRAELMSLAKERGHTTKNTMKKADLVELLSA